jgi:hypothetical protein
MFQRYVASVLDGYCKSRSGYCICCNDCTHILQAYVLNALFFPDVCCKCVYLDVAYVFILQVFYLDVAYVLQWF